MEKNFPPKNGKIALQSPRTSWLSTFYYCQVVNRAWLRLLSTYILVLYRVLANCNIKLSNILYHCYYQWPHSVLVKNIYYTSNRSWSTIVRFLHSWAGRWRGQEFGLLGFLVCYAATQLVGFFWVLVCYATTQLATTLVRPLPFNHSRNQNLVLRKSSFWIPASI